MSTQSIEQFRSFWYSQSDTFVQALCDDLTARIGSYYEDMTPERHIEMLQRQVNNWQAALQSGDPTPILEASRQVALEFASRHFNFDDAMVILNVMREHLWRMMHQLYAQGDWDMDVVELIERWLHENRAVIASSYNQTFQDTWERLAEREDDLESQRQLIQELSTPIMPIHEGILVLPLVGAVDSHRATQIMEAVLEKIVLYQADVLILDITGVPVVDTSVANHLIQMARAVMLLGARIVLVGIGAEIAQTIVQLGVELGNLTTLANLQSGIMYALALKGFDIRANSITRQDFGSL